jgi:hypothetical protein
VPLPRAAGELAAQGAISWGDQRSPSVALDPCDGTIPEGHRTGTLVSTLNVTVALEPMFPSPSLCVAVTW